MIPFYYNHENTPRIIQICYPFFADKHKHARNQLIPFYDVYFFFIVNTTGDSLVDFGIFIKIRCKSLNVLKFSQAQKFVCIKGNKFYAKFCLNFKTKFRESNAITNE